MSIPLPVAADQAKPRASALRRAARGGIWVVVGRMAGLGLAFLVNALLARMLLPPEYGSFSLLISTLGFCAILGRFGLDRTMIRMVAESLGVGDTVRARRALRMGWRLAAATSVLTSLGAMGFLYLFGSALKNLPTGWTLTLAVGAGTVLLAMLSLTAESLRGFHELRFATLFDGRPNGPMINLVFLVAFSGLAFTLGLTLPMVVATYLGAVALVLLVAWRCFRRVSREALRAHGAGEEHLAGSPMQYSQVLSLCVPLWAGQLLGFVVANADVWIAGSRFSAGDLALFVAARNLTSIVAVPVYMANQAIISFIPELHAQGRRHELQRLVQSAALGATLPSLLLLAMIVCWPGLIMSLVFGSFYRDAALVLVVLSLGQFVVCWTGGCQTCLAMTGYHNVQLVIAAGTGAALVVLGALAAWHWGILGLAAVSSLVIAASNIVQWLVARRLVGIWTHAAWVVGEQAG